MDTILAPIDFSDNSKNAIFFAAELSNRSQAGIIAFHALSGGQEDEPLKKMNSLEFELKEKFGGGFKCKFSIERGEFRKVMTLMQETHHPDIIVMGTKGASGLKEIFIGSNTVNVISKTKYPVLIIPESARFEKFNGQGKDKIALATDLEQLNNPDALDILKDIASMIADAKVRVISIRRKGTKLPIIKSMERDRLLFFFSEETEAKRITVFSDDIIGGINYYLRKNNDVGLVAMIAKDTGALFQKHYTREMASHTTVPLLVLHD